MRLWRLPPAMGVGFFPAAAVVDPGNPTDPNADQYWDSVISLAHFDDQAGAKTYNDSKGLSWTVGDAASIDTSFKKFGAGSLFLPGQAGGYFETANDSKWNFGTNDFTIEMWVYWRGNAGGLISRRNGVAEGWAIQIEESGLIALRAKINGTWNDSQITSAVGAIKKETWQHVALTRRGEQWTLWINGSSVVSRAISGALDDVSRPVRLGQATSINYNENPFYGFLDDVRVTNGQARYTAAFTPPTAAFPDKGVTATDPYYSNVVLLQHMDGDGTDKKGHTFDVAGSPAWDTSGAFGKGMALTSGASGLVATSTTDFAFGTGDFTVELFFRATPGATGGMALLAHFDTSGAIGWEVYMDEQGFVYWYEYTGNGNYPVGSKGLLRDGNLHHVAFSRKAGALYMFVDGVQQAGVAVNNTNYGSTGITLSVGYQAQGSARYPFRGTIDEVRITKGVARYAADFAVPTAAFPDAGPTVATDPYYSNVLISMPMDTELFADRKGHAISSPTSKYPVLVDGKFGKAAQFDGSGATLLVAASSDLALARKSFTVELWVKTTQASDSSIARRIIAPGKNTNSYPFQLALDIASSGDGKLWWDIAGSGIAGTYEIKSTVVVNDGTWHHLAMVREAQTSTSPFTYTYRLFVDGVEQGSKVHQPGDSNDSYLTRFDTEGILLGGRSDNSLTASFAGIIDDFRLTVDVARYTKSFTPPTAPYPNA